MIKEYSLKRDGDYSLRLHFKVKEFACKDGSDKILIDLDGMTRLENLRVELNRPIIVNSGYRTESYNKSINGAPNSYHCKGQAFDITANGISMVKLALYASRVGFNGIIIYKDFVHVDTRDNIYYEIKYNYPYILL